jgi:hypothetical protein
VRSDNATQVAPSPDGQWIAFDERFQTYIAPFPRSGRPVDIGPASVNAFQVGSNDRTLIFTADQTGCAARVSSARPTRSVALRTGTRHASWPGMRINRTALGRLAFGAA